MRKLLPFTGIFNPQQRFDTNHHLDFQPPDPQLPSPRPGRDLPLLASGKSATWSNQRPREACCETRASITERLHAAPGSDDNNDRPDEAVQTVRAATNEPRKGPGRFVARHASLKQVAAPSTGRI